MPCSDTTAQFIIYLDKDERVRDFLYSKMTCGKKAADVSGLREYCRERSIFDLAAARYEELPFAAAAAADSEEDFLLHLEWSALRAGIAWYLGREEEAEAARFQLGNILYEEAGVEIRLVLPAVQGSRTSRA